ncbi:DUF6233 domain-containing protein [Streptomyces sp. QL37]|nr:DUF6233 domain-containing protein [Streptomyces sp. QL37]
MPGIHTAVGAGLFSREDAMVALAEPDTEPCGVCRPDTRLTHG